MSTNHGAMVLQPSQPWLLVLAKNHGYHGFWLTMDTSPEAARRITIFSQQNHSSDTQPDG
jgi:hypothetical protein